MKHMMRAMIVALCMMIAVCAQAETGRGDLGERFARELHIEHDGVVYRMRSRVSTLMVAGIDAGTAERAASEGYRSGGQADFIMLLVIDDDRDTIQPVQISRDTMTDITVLNVMGDVSGTRYAQICLAHGFGDGAEQSCGLLADAVSTLLLGVPVDEYYVVDLDGIAAFNDALGGVEIVLAEDLTMFDPAMKKGETLTLTGAQAEIYVRGRYGVGDGTDASRQQRQRQYLEAAAVRIVAEVSQDAGFFEELNDALSGHVVTDIGRGRMINIAKLAADYDILPVMEIAGEYVVSDDGYMEFYPDMEMLGQTVTEVFMQPAE